MPRFYEKPYVGQPFRIMRNAATGVYEEGAVGNVKVNGVFVRDGVSLPAWSATIPVRDGSEFRFDYTTRAEIGRASCRERG